jgi:hypothetical protein
MKFTIQESDKTQLLDTLKTANLAFQAIYPGDKPDRQPVHTVYGGANLFKSDTCVRMGEIALANLQTYAPNFVVLARVLQLPGYEHLPHGLQEITDLTSRLDSLPDTERRTKPAWLAHSVYTKIRQKLQMASATGPTMKRMPPPFGPRWKWPRA